MQDPYKILGIDKNITKDELKKHYSKLQLKYHPDRKTGNKDLYLQIVEAYKTLSTQKVSILDLVDDFKSNYVGSEEERLDLINLYKKHIGDMRKIIESHLCSERKDEDRLRVILDDLIAKKIIKKYKIYDVRVSKVVKKKKKKRRKELEENKFDLSRMEEILDQTEDERKEYLNKLETEYTSKSKERRKKGLIKKCKSRIVKKKINGDENVEK